MPNIKSAKDRVKTNLRDQLRNKAVKSSIRSSLKRIDTAVEENKLENIDVLYKDIEKMIDKAASKGIVHKNKASRVKSRCYHKIEKAKA
jgi:small subunit ribosomal protein S20